MRNLRPFYPLFLSTIMLPLLVILGCGTPGNGGNGGNGGGGGGDVTPTPSPSPTPTPSTAKPEAFNLTVTAAKSQPVTFDLEADGPSGTTLTYGSPTGVQHGSVSKASGGSSVTYAPTAGYVGPDNFTYKASTSAADSDPAQVHINVIDTTLNGWAKTFGSVSADQVFGQAVDIQGNLYVTGKFTEVVDFDPGPASALGRTSGKTNAFVAKYSAGGQLLWLRNFAGTGDGYGAAVALDGGSNVYLAGVFSGSVTIDTATSAKFTGQGASAAFVVKLTTDGSFQWAVPIDGAGADTIHSLAVDALGNVYAGGSFTGSIDFNSAQATDTRTSKGLRDGFITRWASNGQYVWTDTFGGSADDEVTAVAVDPGGGSVYAAGSFGGSMLIDSTANLYVTAAGGSDIFLVKLNTSGQRVWHKAVGGAGDDKPLALAINSTLDVAVGGFFQQTVNFAGDTGTDQHTSAGNSDAFVTVFNTSGGYSWTRTFGDAGPDFVNSVAFDAGGNVYAAGAFAGTVNFDFTGGTDTRGSKGGLDVFGTKITVMNTTIGYGWTITAGGPGDDIAFSVAVDKLQQAAFWGGSFQQTANLRPAGGTENHISFGADDCFIVKTTLNGAW